MALDITFPDGSVKQFPDGTTVKAITEGISNSLAKKAVAGKLDDELIAYNEPIAHSGKLQIMTKDDAEGLTVLRQTAAFVLAAALKALYPDIHFGKGQAIEDGFYYDTDRADGQVSVDDLPTVQKKMEEIIKANAALEPVELSRAEAFDRFKDDPFKKQLVEAAGDPIKGYKLGDFVDFEEKVLLPSLKDLKHFKLLSVAGAYWQGKSSNPMLQRIYGTAYWSEKALKMMLSGVRKRLNVITGLSAATWIFSSLILKSALGCRTGCQMAQRFGGSLNATSLTKKLPMVTNMFTPPCLPTLTCTRRPATGIIIVKTCSRRWTWAMAKCSNYVR